MLFSSRFFRFVDAGQALKSRVWINKQFLITVVFRQPGKNSNYWVATASPFLYYMYIIYVYRNIHAICLVRSFSRSRTVSLYVFFLISVVLSESRRLADKTTGQHACFDMSIIICNNEYYYSRMAFLLEYLRKAEGFGTRHGLFLS